MIEVRKRDGGKNSCGSGYGNIRQLYAFVAAAE